MKRFAWLFAAMLVLLPASCNELDPEGGKNPFTPISLTTKQTGYVQAGTAFAWKFIDQVDEHARKEKEKEWFVSPLSLQIALGMLLNGAQNETAAEICRTLGYDEGETAEINAWCKLMLEQLPKVDKKTDLALADAIFYNKKLTLKGPFRNDVTSWYDAQLEALDFSKTKASADVINKWCDKQTKGMIPHVLDEVSPTALAYLVNALYFKSEWAEKFPKGNTQNETFTDEAGQKSQVKMMKLAGKEFNYGETDLCQIVNLPYGNGNFAMTVFLPKSGHTVSELTAEMAKGALPRFFGSAEVDLWLPRFETKYHIQLNGILCQLGMPSAFNPGKA
ncbi:MAG: serpin family protein, partial [Bacteroidales bacterium]|nr:serpin family protein [Bacteroidales bacterium]